MTTMRGHGDDHDDRWTEREIVCCYFGRDPSIIVSVRRSSFANRRKQTADDGLSAGDDNTLTLHVAVIGELEIVSRRVRAPRQFFAYPLAVIVVVVHCRRTTDLIELTT